MPKGQRNKAVETATPEPIEMVDAIAPEPTVEIAAPVAQKSVAAAEDLATYAARIERNAQPLAVCVITHPDAVSDTIFEGVYAGIRLINGPVKSARLSDGSLI